jgi:hypothetical protein
VQIPDLLEDSRLIDGHSHVPRKMFGPCGYQVLQAEQAAAIQAFVEPALECTVSPKCRLDFLHQDTKLLSIIAGDGIFDCYCDWPVVVVGNDGQIMQVIERRGINASFRGEVD